MNKIIKFTDYKINENVIIPVVDAVISNNGILNTKTSNDIPLKGNVELKDEQTGERSPSVPYTGKTGKELTRVGGLKTIKVVDKIKGLDGNYYPGGLDKNGNLIGSKFDNDGNLLSIKFIKDNNNEEEQEEIDYNKDYNEIKWIIDDRFPNNPIPIEGELRSKLVEKDQVHLYWNKNVNYIRLVPKTPTGWVNVKVDMEVIKRVRRYSIGLSPESDGNTSVDSFLEKLKSLDRISNKALEVRKSNRRDIQQQMSAIILLHYINEIKTFFNPATAGCLFESFLGGLIPDAKVTDDNGKADISVTTPNGEIGYQVKLYGSDTTNITIALKEGGIPLDYYLICIKKSDMIIIYVLNSVDPRSASYYEKFKSEPRKGESKSFSMSKISNSTDLNIRNSTRFSISVTNLEQRIADLGAGLKTSLDELYHELSKFQYNVESIITGVDEDTKKVMDNYKFAQISNSARKNVENMKGMLESLISNIRNPNY